MKLIIDIPEEDYIRLRDEGMFGNVTTFKRAVREGVPLEQEPCTDAISREAVIDIIEDVCPIYGNDYRYILREKVNELPPVNPAEKQEPCENPHIYECPCGYGWDKSKVVRHHFCPNCGRKVQEAKE